MMKYKEFSLNDAETIKRYLSFNQIRLCDYSFSNLFCWGESYNIKWKIHDDLLLIYDKKDDYHLFPVGRKITSEELLKISDMEISVTGSGNFFMVQEDFINENKEFLNKYFQIELNKDYSDYIYLSKSLSELKGKRLHKKRNLISQFKRNHPKYIVKEISPELYRECIELNDYWCKFHSSCGTEDLNDENTAIRKAFNNFSELGFSGLAILEDKKVLAFSVYDTLTEDTALVHFEKSLIECKGAAQIINHEIAKEISKKFRFIDRETDMGIEGLRKAKRSYEPDHMSLSYFLNRK